MGAVAPWVRPYEHVERLAAVLQRVADGDLKRVMIFTPPRSGKSLLVSRLLPAYYLSRYPGRFCGITSYSFDLAGVHSRACRELALAGGVHLREDSRAIKHFETTRGGGCWSAGVGGSITGKGAHLVIVDDPLKNAEEASSEALRLKQREWWRSTLYTRLEPDAALILVMTRWHESDLAGWLLDEERSDDDEPERWHILHMPAIADEPPDYPETCTVEPEWRCPGEALCPDRYSIERLRKIKQRIGSYYWNCLYAQKPAPPEGSFFKRAWFPISEPSLVEAVAGGTIRTRYWDKASSEGKGDYTVGVLVSRQVSGVFWIEDVVRGRRGPAEREAMIVRTAQLDRERYGTVTIFIEQEPGSGGKDSALVTAQHLAGFDVRIERVTGDKETRARPLAAQAEAGNVRILRGEWNAAFLNEIAEFPYGAHDDQVDAAGGAFAKVAMTPKWVIS